MTKEQTNPEGGETKMAENTQSNQEKPPVQEVSLTVAECSEYHSMGQLIENISSVKEAIELFNSIPPDRMNGIPSICVRVMDAEHEKLYDEIDIFNGKSFDMEFLHYVPEIETNKKAQFFIAELMHEFHDCGLGRKADRDGLSVIKAGINHTINLVIGRTWYMSNENIIKQILLLKFMKGIGPVKINTDYVPLIKKGLTLDELRTKLSDNGAVKDEIENAYVGMLEAYSKIESRDDIKVITVCDEEYPRKLMDMGNKRPTVLLVKGDASLLYDDAIAVIGTRKPSKWSVQAEENLVKKINEISDKVIVSGLADGCDYIAHTACINNGGKTLVCLPCGFDAISPASHKELSEIILKNGGTLITEYWPEEEATRYTFVERDNIIAALSDSTLVIECEKTSGTMHTVRAAEKYKRLLGAFITEKNNSGNYEGNEYMIKELRAQLIENTADLEVFVNKSHCSAKKEIKQLSFADFGYWER